MWYYLIMENNYYRTMALDLGDARIGIALSDLMGIIASGYETYNRSNLEADCKHIAEVIEKNNVKVVVIGLPKNMDGTCGPRVEKTYDFAKVLKTYTNAEIDYLDERLTTVAAEKFLLSADVSREKRKKVIDKIAATIILQDYLDTKKRGN